MMFHDSVVVEVSRVLIDLRGGAKVISKIVIAPRSDTLLDVSVPTTTRHGGHLMHRPGDIVHPM